MTYLKKKYVSSHPKILCSPRLCHEDNGVYIMELHSDLHVIMCVKRPPWCPTHARHSIIVSFTPGPWVSLMVTKSFSLPKAMGAAGVPRTLASWPSMVAPHVSQSQLDPYNMHKSWLLMGRYLVLKITSRAVNWLHSRLTELVIFCWYLIPSETPMWYL